MTPEWLIKIWDGTLANAIPLIFIWFGFWRLGRIEKKMDLFVTKDAAVVMAAAIKEKADVAAAALKETADREHDMVWAEIRAKKY